MCILITNDQPYVAETEEQISCEEMMLAISNAKSNAAQDGIPTGVFKFESFDEE